MSAPDRGEMLDRADKALSIRRQCALLCVARSGVYRAKRPANDNDLILMRRIDELFMAYPFYGSRRMTLQLRSEGHDINRKRVQRIMRTMGIVALGPKPNTSKPAPGHKIYPYLLRGLKIERPNHVWCADITYIPIGRGFLYLVALMDWASRAVLSWRLSNTMDASFCVEAREEALATYGKPEIFNTDQGSQFTGMDFTGAWLEAGIQISMDGRGRWMDNVFIERLWRSLKHEDIYLKHYADGHEAKAGISAWIDFYNTKLQHKALSSGAAKPDADGGPARRRRRIGWRWLWICGQRKSVTHRPTAADPASGCMRRRIKERTRSPTRNQLPLVLMTGSTSQDRRKHWAGRAPWCKPSGLVQFDLALRGPLDRGLALVIRDETPNILHDDDGRRHRRRFKITQYPPLTHSRQDPTRCFPRCTLSKLKQTWCTHS